MEDSTKQKLKVAAIVGLFLIVVVVIGIGVVASTKKPIASTANVAETPSTTTPTPTPAPAVTPAPATSSYKDGTYTAVGSYTSPEGTEIITISVTLEGDTVADTTATGGATDPQSMTYQDDFIGGYKKLVVGKNIDTVKLSRVSGSSLTSGGFNAALTKIKAQAKT